MGFQLAAKLFDLAEVRSLKFRLSPRVTGKVILSPIFEIDFFRQVDN